MEVPLRYIDANVITYISKEMQMYSQEHIFTTPGVDIFVLYYYD